MSDPAPNTTGTSSDRVLTPQGEARRLLAAHPEPDSEAALAAAMHTTTTQLGVLQTRSQLLLTLGTLVLTITGFSGPKIVDASTIARITMPIGLVLVLTAMVIILVSTLRIRWVTQFTGTDPIHTLTQILHYRNAKTRVYRLELLLLVIGMVFYVISVVVYMIQPLFAAG